MVLSQFERYTMILSQFERYKVMVIPITQEQQHDGTHTNTINTIRTNTTHQIETQHNILTT